METFQAPFINGHGSLTKITNEYQKQIRLLVDDKINNDDDNNNNEDDVLCYTKQLFTNMLDKIQWINVDI